MTTQRCLMPGLQIAGFIPPLSQTPLLFVQGQIYQQLIFVMNKICVFCEVGIVWLLIIAIKFCFERFCSRLEKIFSKRCQSDTLGTHLTSLCDLVVSSQTGLGSMGFN